jgi:tetratricopeptide (TPR) repeat protein
LAAEIYSGSAGTRGNALVDQHFEKALHWARVGEALAPDDFHPVLAEAHCLESMGRYDEAVAARTRAINLSSADVPRCECLHYRWRLHYWLGELDAALADAQAHAECMPESRAYAHVYPALIRAEMGDLAAARTHARALADTPPTDPLAVLWSATTLRLLGDTDEAAALLADREPAIEFAAAADRERTETWLRALYAAAQTGDGLDDLEALAQQSEQPWRLWGEAYFHDAARRLAEGDRAGARSGFERAHRAFDGETQYTYHAKLILERMQADPVWPTWIPPATKTVPETATTSDTTVSRAERLGN